MDSGTNRPTSASKSAPPAKTPEQQDAELFAHDRRAATRFAAGMGALLLGLTLYFAGLNAWRNMRAEPAPFRLTVESPLGLAQDATFRASTTWREMARPQAVTRPLVLIDGVSTKQRGATVRVGKPTEVRIVVPSNTTPGRHNGELVLERVSGPDSLPRMLSAPIVVEATGGFWASWFIVRDWFMLAAVFCGILYAICLVMFPPPSGELGVRRIAAGMDVTHCVPLGPGFRWLWRPWRRSTVDLERIWKKAAISRVPLRGQIEFMFRGLPQLWHLPQHGKASVFRLGSTPVPAPGVPYPAAGPVEIMGKNHWMVRTENPSQTIVIQYRQNRSFPGFSPPGRR